MTIKYISLQIDIHGLEADNLDCITAQIKDILTDSFVTKLNLNYASDLEITVLEYAGTNNT